MWRVRPQCLQGPQVLCHCDHSSSNIHPQGQCWQVALHQGILGHCNVHLWHCSLVVLQPTLATSAHCMLLTSTYVQTSSALTCAQGLAYYATNSAATNAAVAALLWRIASPDALNLEPMLYQVCMAEGMQVQLAVRVLPTTIRLCSTPDDC